jgi:hypothetical protein
MPQVRTIVDDDGRDTELLGYFCKCLWKFCRFLKVEAQTKISILADTILETSRSKRDLVSFGSECVGYGEADLGAGTENEQYGGRHHVSSKVELLRVR